MTDKPTNSSPLLVVGLDRKVRHMHNSAVPEYSLCGMAFDAYDPGDAEEIIFAKSGETITCTGCRKIIADAKRIKHWKVPNEKIEQPPTKPQEQIR